jgi:hypothetical protein
LFWSFVWEIAGSNIYVRFLVISGGKMMTSSWSPDDRSLGFPSVDPIGNSAGVAMHMLCDSVSVETLSPVINDHNFLILC